MSEAQIEIEIRGDKTNFSPLEWLEGHVHWKFPTTQKRLELRLLWFTQGKGTSDMGIMHTETIEAPHAHAGIELSSGTQPFRLRLPDAPHSFSGTLISLIWALEIEAFPSKMAVQREFILAPGGTEITLSRVTTPASSKLTDFQKRKAEFLARKHSGTSSDSPSPFSSNERGPWS